MKISYFPNQPHCYAFGGFEVQMLSAYHATLRQGCDMELMNPWNRAADFDIVHIWGFEISQFNNIVFSKKAKKKVVVTALIHDLSSWKYKMRFHLSSLVYKQRILKQLLPFIDAFTTVNDVEKEYINKYYHFPLDRISVIPNIIADTYVTPDVNQNHSDTDNLGINDFVLCVGNICQRKNQLNLVKACNRLGTNVLLIGKTMEGEEKYAQKVSIELSKNPASKWIQGVKENSSTLKMAYEQCKAFALLSHYENQPISVPEALAMKCRVLLADKPYARQQFFHGLDKAHPDNIDDICQGLRKVQGSAAADAEAAIKWCSKENVGNLYAGLYRKLLTNSH